MKTTYTAADAAYLGRRRLRRHARVLHLWAMGVGAVISGDFFGWNFGLAAGGFGGMLLAVVVMTAMYIGLCFSIAEMSPALPHAGGAYSFARTAMGPWGGYITGLAENMEYILTPAVIVVGIGGYLGAVFGTPRVGAGLVAAVLRHFRGAQRVGRGDDVPRLGGGHGDRAGGAGGVLGGRGAAFRSASLGLALFPARRASGRGDPAGTALRAVAVPGHRAVAAGRRRESRPAARYAARHSLRPGDADRGLVSDRGAQRRHRAGSGQDRGCPTSRCFSAFRPSSARD